MSDFRLTSNFPTVGGVEMTQEEMDAQFALESREWDDISGSTFPRFEPYLDGVVWRIVRIEADGERYLSEKIRQEKGDIEELINIGLGIGMKPGDEFFPTMWKTYFPVMGSPAADRRDHEMYLSELEYDRRQEDKRAEQEALDAQAADSYDYYYGGYDD